MKLGATAGSESVQHKMYMTNLDHSSTGFYTALIVVTDCVIFQNKCDWVDETSKTYGRPRCRKNATESFHSATGLILSTFNATELNQNFIYL